MDNYVAPEMEVYNAVTSVISNSGLGPVPGANETTPSNGF